MVGKARDDCDPLAAIVELERTKDPHLHRPPPPKVSADCQHPEPIVEPCSKENKPRTWDDKETRLPVTQIVKGTRRRKPGDLTSTILQ